MRMDSGVITAENKGLVHLDVFVSWYVVSMVSQLQQPAEPTPV
jgi:hypothetical protein